MAKKKTKSETTATKLVASCTFSSPWGGDVRAGQVFEAKPVPRMDMTAADSAAYLIKRGFAEPKTDA